EHGADFRRRLLEVARELDFLVTARGHTRDRALDVFFHLVTHGVELQADTLDLARDEGVGVRGSGVQQVRRCRSTEGLYEFAPIRHCGFSRVLRVPNPDPRVRTVDTASSPPRHAPPVVP